MPRPLLKRRRRSFRQCVNASDGTSPRRGVSIQKRAYCAVRSCGARPATRPLNSRLSPGRAHSPGQADCPAVSGKRVYLHTLRMWGTTWRFAARTAPHRGYCGRPLPFRSWRGLRSSASSVASPATFRSPIRNCCWYWPTSAARSVSLPSAPQRSPSCSCGSVCYRAFLSPRGR